MDLSSVSDLNEREALEVQIAEFGQVPQQVFMRPHPRKNISLGLYDALYLTPSDSFTPTTGTGVKIKRINMTYVKARLLAVMLNSKVDQSLLPQEQFSNPCCDSFSNLTLNCDTNKNVDCEHNSTAQEYKLISTCVCDNYCDKSIKLKDIRSRYTHFSALLVYFLQYDSCCISAFCTGKLRRKYLARYLLSILCDKCQLTLSHIISVHHNSLSFIEQCALFHDGGGINCNVTCDGTDKTAIEDAECATPAKVDCTDFNETKEVGALGVTVASPTIHISTASQQLTAANSPRPPDSLQVTSLLNTGTTKETGSSKIQDLFAMIKTDISSTLKKNKREKLPEVAEVESGTKLYDASLGKGTCDL